MASGFGFDSGLVLASGIKVQCLRFGDELGLRFVMRKSDLHSPTWRENSSGKAIQQLNKLVAIGTKH